MTESPPTESASRRWIHWLVTAMAFVALYAWMTRGNASPLMGEPAPDLTLSVAAGAEPGGPTKVALSEMGGQVVVLDFWASWCGPCKMMAPAFEQAAAQLEPGVRLAKLNTEAEQNIGTQLGIRSIPTMIVFRNGREVARQAGAMAAVDIVRWVQTNS